MTTSRRGEMAIVGARLLRDGERVLVGVGLPNLAANVAKRLHAPHLVLVYESGVIDAHPPRLPLSIGDPDLVRTSLCVLPIGDLFSQYLQTGWIDVGFLGGAQIDRRGNLNSTVIGPYDHPKVRLSGSGGAADIASFARRTIMLIPQDLQRFPAAVDFITSPGHPKRGRRTQGPASVVTDLGLFDFDEEGEMRLTSVYPGVSIKDVQQRTGWPLRIAQEISEIPPPTPAELDVLRELGGGQEAAY
ncbi:MAG: acyl CoA--acetate/3-ketoacid CoA transferase subunit beta [Thermaerobacter sp.]|nr:acyl CoA--acetate/3-ketoacid CoA transferase subunit beta [Thermaerobacter sp.]